MIDRPPRSLSLSRALRSLVGVREELLATTPSERLRYTSLGVIVLTTAAFATLSIGVALYFVFGRFSPWIIPIALVWGAFILNVDRWLASAPPLPGIRALPRVLSRLALAVVLGVVLAEPLMLGIFQTAIEEQVARSRQQEILEFESQLRICNQLSLSSVQPDERPTPCAGKRLSSFDPALIRSEQLARLRHESRSLQAEIERIFAEAADLQEAAIRECSGRLGLEVSGQAGQGPICKQRRELANRYLTDSGLKAKQDRLRSVNAAVSDIEQESDSYLRTAADSIEQEIESEVRQARMNQQAVGLLERLAALHELTREHAYLAGAEWTLRLTLILIEMMPALLRILMGVTNHDRLVRISERERIDAYVIANARSTQDLFDVLETQQRELVSEIPRHRPEVLR